RLLLDLLNEILDLSKLESGKFTLENEPFDLRTTNSELERTLSYRAADKGLDFSCEVAAAVPSVVRGDPQRIRQVLTNLVSNGVKFTEHGKVTVTVSPEARTAQDVRLRFSVLDTGIGISTENLDSVFAPFT